MESADPSILLWDPIADAEFGGMKNSMLFSVVLLLMLPFTLQAQTPGFRDPDEFLVQGDPLPQVLLVGTWHFNYPGLDAHKTTEDRKMDILSPEKQAELQELLDYLARFRPTKIVVEGGRNSGYLMWHYRDWKSGEAPLGRSEIDQIAVRMIDRMGLDTMYGCDAYPLMFERYDVREQEPSDPYFLELTEGFSFGGEDEMAKRYQNLYAYSDEMVLERSLLDNFLYINSPKRLERGFGAYISGGHFNAEDHKGPDALSMNWFNRNLRIFQNIRNIGHGPEDRILVLFGAGHVQILDFLFRCSPEFELVPFDSL